MAKVTYEIVEHDGGWAYKVGAVFSEAFPTHDAAHRAAADAAKRQQVEGTTEAIEYEDSKGEWHVETAEGGDRPEAVVHDATEDDDKGSLARDVGANEPLPDGPKRR